MRLMSNNTHSIIKQDKVANMAVIETSEPSAAGQQLADYNQNIGGNIIKRLSFSVPADTHWCIIGTVLADAAVPADVTSTLIPAIEALPEVTSVNGDQIWGQIPSSILTVDHAAILYVSTDMQVNLGTGDTFSTRTQATESVVPPVNKKWCVIVLRVPSALDDTSIATLETAIEGITGITTCEHLVDGTVSSRASANATLAVAAHVRIEYIEP
jgi:hypothetical protein